MALHAQPDSQPYPDASLYDAAAAHESAQPAHSSIPSFRARLAAYVQLVWLTSMQARNAHPRISALITSLGAALMLIILAASVAPGHAQEQPQNQAGIIIRHGDGSVTTSCVTFSEPSISGVELLQRSGVAVITQQGGIGAAVCKIGGEGCDYPTEDCFCKCKSADCQYWAYQRLHGDRWAYSPLGASAANVLPGDVDGWAWGAGSVQQGAAPPIIPLAQICAAPGTPAATESTQSAETATAAPPATASPLPTTTSVPPTVTRPAPTATASVVTSTATPLPASSTPLATNTALVHTALSVAAVPTSQPTATDAAQPSAGSSLEPPDTAQAPAAAGGYLAFGVIILILIGGIVVAIRRNRP